MKSAKIDKKYIPDTIFILPDYGATRAQIEEARDILRSEKGLVYTNLGVVSYCNGSFDSNPCEISFYVLGYDKYPSRAPAVNEHTYRLNQDGTITYVFTYHVFLPKPTSADEGKILKVVNGRYKLVNP